MVRSVVHCRRRDVRHGSHGLGLSAHGHQHAPDVRMSDDRAGGSAFVKTHCLALNALACIGHGALIGAFGNTHTLETDGEAREVHHDEHVFETAIFLTNHIADGAAMVTVGKHRRRARIDAHLVLDRHTVHVVACAQRAVRIHQHLGHDKERNAFDAFRRIRRARQHEMDDVVGVVVLTKRDVDLLPEQPVGTVTVRYGARAHGREVRACLWLGKIHRARPRARHHIRQVGVLQQLRTAQFDGLDRALRQQWTKIESEIGGVPHFLDRGGHELRQSLSAIVLILGEPVPAVDTKLRIRVLESGRRSDVPAIEPRRSFAVTGTIERVENIGGELRCFVENGEHCVRRRIFETWQMRDLVQAGKFRQYEADVGQRGVVDAHARWILGQ